MKILVVSAMRDEGPFILEWISHYLCLGVSHFLIYTNDCFDNTEEILLLLSDAGIVTLVNNDTPVNQKPPQWRALNMASKHPLLSDFDWVLVTDVDEFVLSLIHI